MISDYCRADMPTVNEPRETAKDILSGTDKLIAETHGLLGQMYEMLIGRDERADLPDVKDATMIDTLTRQRVQIESILGLVVRLKERLY